MAKNKEMKKRLENHCKIEKKKEEKSFNSRWQTLKRKAKCLAKLCNGQVCMVMSTPNGEVDVWPEIPESPKRAEKEPGSIMKKFLEATFKRKGTSKKQEFNLSDFTKKRKVANVTKWHERLDELSPESLTDLSLHLRSKVGQIEETLRSIFEASNQANNSYPRDDYFLPSSADYYCYNINIKPSEEQAVVPAVVPEETRYFSMGCEAVDKHQLSSQNINDFGETQFLQSQSDSDQHEQYPYCFDVLNHESDSMPPLASYALMY